MNLFAVSDPKPLAPGLYTTDAFHRKILIAIKERTGHESNNRQLVVRSWEEAYSLHGRPSIDDVNLAWIARFITGDCSASVSPYKRIKRLPRASNILIETDGTVHAKAFDPFASGFSRIDSSALHKYIRGILLNNLDQALSSGHHLVGCEHSSGIDSNALVGALLRGLKIRPERLHTISWEPGTEGQLLNKFRSLHGLVPDNCHKALPLESCEWADIRKKTIRMLGSPPQLGGNLVAARSLKEQGCSIMFSGFGGDQAISHNGMNALTDLVEQWRFLDLFNWAGNSHNAFKIFIDRRLALSSPKWKSFRLQAKARSWISFDVLKRALTSQGRLSFGEIIEADASAECDYYCRIHDSIRRRTMADWIAVRVEEEIRISKYYEIEKHFPYLDEFLIGSLLAQDPSHFTSGPQGGRLVARQAFADFLPPLLVDNPSKNRNIEEYASSNRVIQKEVLEQLMRDWPELHEYLATWLDLEMVRTFCENVLTANSPSFEVLVQATKALNILLQLSDWFSLLEKT
jgi:hypothetical protein